MGRLEGQSETHTPVRRMGQILWPVVLFLAVAAWAASYWCYHAVSAGTSARYVEVAAMNGRLRLLHKSMPIPAAGRRWRSRTGPEVIWERGLCFSCQRMGIASDAWHLWYRPIVDVGGNEEPTRYPGGFSLGQHETIRYTDSEEGFLYPYTYLEAPLPWLVGAAAMPAAIVLLRHRQGRYRHRRNLCRRCGYDLRAHDRGGRCPECGTGVSNCTSGGAQGKAGTRRAK